MVTAPQEVREPVWHCDLSDESWTMVLQSLMKVDIKSARLVCKRFDRMTIPLLYNIVIVAPHRKVLEVFDAIAGHEVYSRCVKELVYNTAEFGDYDLELYEADLRDQFYKDDESHLLTEAVIAHGFAVYQRYATEQREILDDREDFAHLCMNLRSLERLESFTIDNSWAELLTKEEDSFDRSVLDPPPKSHGFVQRHWNPLHLEPQKCRRFTMRQALMTGLRALSITQTRVKGIFQDCAISPSFFHTTVVSEATLRHAIDVFQHLRRLVLGFDSGSRFTGLLQFAKVLSAASRLQDLSIFFDVPWTKPCVGTIETVFGHRTWMHLRSLNLQGFSFRSAELHDFLGSHSDSLRLMILSNCDLQDDSWTNVVDFLQSDLKLSKCAITQVRKRSSDPFTRWEIL